MLCRLQIFTFFLTRRSSDLVLYERDSRHGGSHSAWVREGARGITAGRACCKNGRLYRSRKLCSAAAIGGLSNRVLAVGRSKNPSAAARERTEQARGRRWGGREWRWPGHCLASVKTRSARSDC